MNFPTARAQVRTQPWECVGPRFTSPIFVALHIRSTVCRRYADESLEQIITTYPICVIGEGTKYGTTMTDVEIVT